MRTPTHMELLALATGMAADGTMAMLYPDDGTNAMVDGAFIRISEAVMSGKAFTVKTSHATVVFDLDYDEHSGLDVMASRLIDELRETEGVCFVHWDSGGVNSEHVVARLRAWKDPNAFVTWARKDLGFPASVVRYGTRARPILSPHREGRPVRLISPTTIEGAISVVKQRGEPKPVSLRRLYGQEPLILTRNGEIDRSKMLQSYLKGAINSDVPREIRLRLARNAPGPVGDKARECDKRGDLERKDEDARRSAATNPPSASFDIDTALRDIEQAASLTAWIPRTMPNDRATLAALCGVARQAHSLRFSRSDRSLGELAGMDRSSLRRSIDRLVDIGFVHRVESSPDGETSSYVLSSPSLTHPLTISREDAELLWTSWDPSHDAWAPRAHGKLGWLLFSILPPDGLTAHQITQLCGYASSRPVRQRLREMHVFGGLVEVDEEGVWRAVPAPDLDAVAVLLGTNGRRAHIRALNIKARTEWAKWRLQTAAAEPKSSRNRL